MEKQLKILVDNLFDKEFNDIYNTDLDSEIANECLHYNVGDFIYNDKKKPYAICCADKFDFKDQKERFILFNNVKNKRWCLISDINFNVNNINNENGLIVIILKIFRHLNIVKNLEIMHIYQLVKNLKY